MLSEPSDGAALGQRNSDPTRADLALPAPVWNSETCGASGEKGLSLPLTLEGRCDGNIARQAQQLSEL